MAKHSILGISGSLRAEATNRKLLQEAARLFEAASYTEASIDLPLYNGDDEANSGVPAAVQTLADQIEAADAIMISTPEYNKGPSGALKNALDWVSRVNGNPWADKPVAVMSAAAGRAGGERAQMVLRGFMVPFQPRLITGPEIHLAASHSAFDDKVHLTSEIYIKDLTALMAKLRREIAGS